MTITRDDGPSEAPKRGRRKAVRTSQLWRARDRFHFSLRIALTVSLIVCCTMTALGLWLSRHVHDAEIDNAADQSAFYMNVLFSPALRGLPTDRPIPSEVMDHLDSTLGYLKGRPVLTVVIWWRDGTVAYSTDKAMIGRQFNAAQLESVFAGTIRAHISDALTDHGARRQEAVGLPLLEIYAPLRDSETDIVFAAGEFYQDASHLLADIRRLNTAIWSTVALATALMLAMLALVAGHARAVVEAHRTELSRRLIEASQLASDNADLLKAAEKARIDAFQINEDLLHKLGADIHDGPLQLLGLIMLRLEGFGEQSRSLLEDPVQRAKTIDFVARTVKELRDMSGGLTLPEIGALDLEQTIRLAVARHESNTETSVLLQFDELPRDTSMPLRICVYRVVQEALNNAFWHADGAGQVVRASLADGGVVVAISDAGQVRPDRPSKRGKESSLGLQGLARRVAAFGGSVEVSAPPGGGTTVTARFPVTRDEQRMDDDDIPGGSPRRTFPELP